jgi:hypothetical protein
VLGLPDAPELPINSVLNILRGFYFAWFFFNLAFASHH